MSWENTPILVILILSVLGHNQSVAVAAAFLLIVKLLGLDSWLPAIESNGLSIGITVLTIAVLAPVVNGRVSLQNIAEAFSTPLGWLAIAAGIFAAWAAGRGLFFIKDTPQVVSSLVLGTVVGVSFLKGIAIGPLIAGGLVSIVVALFHTLQ